MSAPVIGSVFSGVAGLELGLSLAIGGTVGFQVEIDPYARAVLEARYPDATRRNDVRMAHRWYGIPGVGPVLCGGLERPDVFCGGFPCTDISLAGRGAGLEGEQSRLWWELYRLVLELRPDYVVVENVPALASRGLGAVLGALADAGFDAEWGLLSARSVGAPHLRKRLFVVAWQSDAVGKWTGRLAGSPAHADGLTLRPEPIAPWAQGAVEPAADGDEERVADADGLRERRGPGSGQVGGRANDSGEASQDGPGGAGALADADSRGGSVGRLLEGAGPAQEPPGRGGLADADGEGPSFWQELRGDPLAQLPAALGGGWWAAEPGMGRVVDGLPHRLDRRRRPARIRCLGRAVVPLVAYEVGLILRDVMEGRVP